MNSIAIHYQGVTKDYDLPRGEKFTALKKLDLSIYKGECFGLLGPNGAGKTTAINLLAGVLPISSGDITVFEKSVKNHSVDTKKYLGVVQQELIVDSFFDLTTMLSLQSKLSGVKPDKEWINFLLEILMLKEHAKKTTRELSGGMKRRMMIARALVHKPQILVLDEPTAGVDVHLRYNMWEFVRSLHKFGMTIILTTHYLEEAEQFCSRIAIMNKGEMTTLKSNHELLALGGNPVVVMAFKPNQNPESVNDLPKYIIDECHKHSVKCEINVNEKDKHLIFKREFNSKDFSSFQDSSAIIHNIVQKIDGHVMNIYTSQPSLEDVFIELTNERS